MRYVLASGSPRRKELLRKVIEDYEILIPEGEEVTDSKEPHSNREEFKINLYIKIIEECKKRENQF